MTPPATPSVPVRFRLSERHRFRDNDPLWNAPLPPQRTPATAAGAEEPLRYGQYFESVRRFLLADGGHALACVVGEQLGTALQPSDLQAVDIRLAKHGQYYHPARVRVRCADAEVSLVVNVAATAQGKLVLRRDFENLRRLSARDPWGFLPRVYRLAPGTGPRSPALFMGQWLQGFDEFHLSAAQPDGGYTPVVWAPAGPRRLISMEADGLYRGAAALLTAFYNPETFEHIAQWHHAAGDFVVDADADPPAVRLITVRSYAPLLEEVRLSTETVLLGLLLFLVNMTVRMRFDRLDGTGAMVLASTQTVFPVLEGFWQGLVLREHAGLGLEDLISGFSCYLRRWSEPDLAELVDAVIERLPSGTPQRAPLRRQASRHAAALASAAARSAP